LHRVAPFPNALIRHAETVGDGLKAAKSFDHFARRAEFHARTIIEEFLIFKGRLKLNGTKFDILV
jgi:hypothetical protein